MVYLLSLSKPINFYPELRVFKRKRLNFIQRISLLFTMSYYDRRDIRNFGYKLISSNVFRCMYLVDLSDKKHWNQLNNYGNSIDYKILKEILREDLRDSKIDKILSWL